MHCVERLFPSHEKLLAQKEMLSFQHPSITVSRTEKGHFIFFLSFSDRDLCTKRESRTSSRDLKTRDSNPNLSAKVHEEAKQKGGTDFNIQHKRKRYLKVALSFCCKREEGCSTYAMKMCLYFFYFFFSFLFLVLFTNGRTD